MRDTVNEVDEMSEISSPRSMHMSLLARLSTLKVLKCTFLYKFADVKVEKYNRMNSHIFHHICTHSR